MAETPASTKPVHTIVLDAGPLLKNVPPLSTLLAQSEELVTTPSVINEIRDADARTRIETLYLPFLKQRSPSPKSVNVLSEFARKTGDRAVLSKVDVELLALAYEIECERNGGDWRLRSVPGQKGVNGRPPVKERAADEGSTESNASDGQATEQPDSLPISELEGVTRDLEAASLDDPTAQGEAHSEEAASAEPPTTDEAVEGGVDESQGQEDEDEEENEEDSDGGDWITPSNIKRRQAKDETMTASTTPEPKVMQVATMTTDFACQNVLLQMNLNLLSTTTLQRIRHLKTFIKRCHACFFTTKEMDKQFCPRCGKDTLTRVSCSTDANGQFKLHLKKNMQWNTRGNRYSVPKAQHGNASGKWKGGGGQGGWGNDLILAEDQKEFVRGVAVQKRQLRRERDLMDEDYLPGILTGERNKTAGRVKVGAGRNVNSRKR